MKHAADTCLVMINKITALGAVDTIEKMNTFARMVATKEVHAERVKHELAVLWGDYFKPEHLEDHPDLHDKVWKALKQAGKVKQTVDNAEAQNLVEAVAEIADIYASTKQ